jgi:colanic acid/amylovoran biosynthesis glycosyltransferase
MATWSDDMNLVVSEALATGLPVITTFHSGLPEQVIDGGNGKIVPENDAIALAQAILDMAAEHDRWEDFSREARRHVTEFYNSVFLIESQIELYNEAMRHSLSSS